MLTNKHKSSTFRVYQLSDFREIALDPVRWIVICTDGHTFESNWLCLNDATPRQDHYIVDSTDSKWILENSKNEQERVEYYQNWDKLTDRHYKKRIYLRTFPNIHDTNPLVSVVLASEVWNAIPVLLSQQGTHYPEHKGLTVLLHQLKNEWKLANLMPVPDLAKVLERFDINKNLVTAVLKIFQQLVCGVNWEKLRCDKHKDCISKQKQRILDFLDKVNNPPIPLVYITERELNAEIQKLQSPCITKLQSEGIETDYKLEEFEDPNRLLPVLFYLKACENFGLKVYRTFIGANDAFDSISVWMTRILLLIGWVDYFFPRSIRIHMLGVLHRFQYAIHDKIPNDMMDEMRKVWDEVIWDNNWNAIQAQLERAEVLRKVPKGQNKMANQKPNSEADAQAEKLREKAEKRKQALKERKEAKKQGIGGGITGNTMGKEAPALKKAVNLNPLLNASIVTPVVKGEASTSVETPPEPSTASESPTISSESQTSNGSSIDVSRSPPVQSSSTEPESSTTTTFLDDPDVKSKIQTTSEPLQISKVTSESWNGSTMPPKPLEASELSQDPPIVGKLANLFNIGAQYVTALEKRILPDFDMDNFLEDSRDRAQKNDEKLEECISGDGKKTLEDLMKSEAEAKPEEVMATPSETSEVQNVEAPGTIETNQILTDPEAVQTLVNVTANSEDIELTPAESSSKADLAMTSKHKDTKLKTQPYQCLSSVSFDNANLWAVNAICFNGQTLSSNLSYFTKETAKKYKPKLFFLDAWDTAWARHRLESENRTNQKGVNSAKYIISLEGFLKEKETKRFFYIRRISSEYSGSGTKRFLTDDVLDIISLILKLQNSSSEVSNAFLEKYGKKWKSNNEHEYNSIDLAEFKSVLEEFDVNKRKIVVVEDIVYMHTQRRFIEKGESFACSVGSDGKMILYPSHAVFQVFQSAFCGVNWTVDKCKKHKNCMESYRQLVIDLMNEYAEMDKTTFISWDILNEKIIKIKTHCTFDKQMNFRRPYDGLAKYDFQNVVPMEEYLIVCQHFTLPTYHIQMMRSQMKNKGIPVWRARIFYLIRWAQYFYHLLTDHLLIFLIEALVMKAPEEERAEIENDVRQIILSDCHDSFSQEGKHVEEIIMAARNRQSAYIRSKNKENIKNKNVEEPVKVEEQQLTASEIETTSDFLERRKEPTTSGTESGNSGDVIATHDVEVPERNDKPTTSEADNNSPRSFLLSSEIEKLAADQERGNQKLAQKENKKKSMLSTVEKHWCDYSKYDFNIATDDPTLNPTISPVTCGNEVYYSNFMCFEFEYLKKRLPKYFMMNAKDRDNALEKLSSEDLRSLEGFSKSNNTKFVIRSISLSDNVYILTEDILELVPILMKRQNIPANEYEEKLKNLRQMWDTKDSSIFKSIPVDTCKNILDDFKVDRDLITIIPDIVYPMTAHQYAFKSGLVPSFIWTLNNNGHRVSTVNHTLYFLFRMLICGVKWANDWPKDTRIAIDNFKTHFFKHTEKLMQLPPGTFSAEKYVPETVNMFKNHPMYSNVHQHFLLVMEFNSVLKEKGLINYEVYKARSLEYGFDVHEEQSGMKEIPIWLANAYIKIGFMKSFYSEEMTKLKSILVEELAFTIPKDYREERKIEMLEYVNRKQKSEILKEGSETKNVSENLKEEKNTPSTSNTSDSEACNPSEAPIKQPTVKAADEQKGGTSPKKPQKQNQSPAEHFSLNPPQTSQKPKTKTIARKSPAPDDSKDTKPVQSQSKLCDKCTRNGQKLLEAQAELQTAVNKANKYEEKAKKTTQMEKDMKKIRKENEELKKELEKIKNELKDSKEKEEKSKETIQKLTENVGELELQVKREQQRVIVGQQENAQLRQRVEGIQLKFAINQSKIEEEFAKKDLLICKLRKMHSDKFSRPPTSSELPESSEETPSGSSEPSTSNPEEAGKSSRWHLIKWQKIKDKINMDQVLNEQKDMIERLISVTQDREVKNLAEYEQTRFEGTKNIYLQTIEMNIQKIKKTDDFSNLLPIPEYPKLSTEFLAKFTEEMKNQPEVSEVGLSPETNCYICFEPYVDKDVKKICKECNKPVHLECDNTWRSKQKDQNIPDDDTCAFCRGKMEEKKEGKKEKKK